MPNGIDEEFEGMILDIDKDRVYIKLDNNVKCLLDINGEFAESFDIDNDRKALLSKYSKNKVKLGTRIKAKVTRVNIPQKEIYLDIKEIIKDHNKPHIKKLEKNKNMIN